VNSLLSVAEARQRLLDAFHPVETEMVQLTLAAGRVLSHEIVSEMDLPLFANSSMDGFAVRSSDVANAAHEEPVNLKVIGDVPAGTSSSVTLESGETVRIMTGAPLPDGADSVVPVEDTDHYRGDMSPDAPLPDFVAVRKAVQEGDYVRPKGQDVHSGEIVLPGNLRLRPQDVGFLAMLGISGVPVYRRPKVALLSTGDELVPVDQPLTPGKIHESNAYTLASLVHRDGGEAINLGVAPDRQGAVRDILDRSVESQADLILSSAGVSVGAFDFVRTVVQQHGELAFWRVNMRPGKPLAFGRYRGIPFIGLPGNPVSAFVGYEVFVHPALLKMSGQSGLHRPSIKVKLLEPVTSDGRESYLRSIVKSEKDGWFARLTGHQGSGNLRSLVRANALLVIPAGVKSLPAGSEVEAWLLGDT
jgi:molybdopterin molybdotransferase